MLRHFIFSYEIKICWNLGLSQFAIMICRSRVSIIIVETCDLWLICNWFNWNIKYRIWNEELDFEHVSTPSKMEKDYN